MDSQVDTHIAYRDYMAFVESDLGVILTDSLDVAKDVWGVRLLSEPEFQDVLHHEDRQLVGRRWKRRLRGGFHFERSMLASEIEDVFADVPVEGSPADPNQGHEAAA